MNTVIIIRADSRLKEALEKLAHQQGISVSALIRQNMIKILQDHGIDWRKEKQQK